MSEYLNKHRFNRFVILVCLLLVIFNCLWSFSVSVVVLIACQS